METVDKVIKLLSQTDGRDKIYKFGANASKLVAWTQATQSPSTAKAFNGLAGSIGEGRSLMRMGKWVGNASKLNAAGKKIGNLSHKELLEVLRVIGDFGYVLGDNLAYLAKYKVISVTDAKTASTNAKIFQFWGFVCAFLIDICNLVLLSTKKLEDKVFKKEQKALLLTAVKDFCDLLVTLNNVKYIPQYNPTTGFTAACGATSGAIATYVNWNKIK